MRAIEKENISGYVILTLELSQVRGGRRWVGKCLQTGTVAFDETISLTSEQLSSLVALQLRAVDKVNQREHYFQEHEIIFYPQLPKQYELKLPVNSAAYYRALILANVPGKEEGWFRFKPVAK